jgi:PIN domain nuclease of toxin-antitoxin system
MTLPEASGRSVPHVLDASAILAFLHREPGWDLTAMHLTVSVVSTVNWCEVLQKALSRGVSQTSVRRIENVGLELVDFTPVHAALAADLWVATRSAGLSLADRACLALGIERQLPVLTADRRWSELGLNVEIVLLR